MAVVSTRHQVANKPSYATEKWLPLESSAATFFFLDCLTLQDGTESMSRNVGYQLPVAAHF
jgi:hypothetical protein